MSEGMTVEFRSFEQSEQINEFAGAMAKAQGAITNAKKDVENTFFKSKYADLASVIDACRAPLSANGIAVIQTPALTPKGDLEVTTHLLHASGQWMRSTLAAKPAKLDPQGIGSASTYLRRYGLSAMVGVAAEDDDGNGSSNQTDNAKLGAPAERPKRPTPKNETPTDDFDPGLFADGFMGQVNKAKLGEISGIIDMNRSELDRLPKALRESLIEKAHARTHDLDKQEHETPIQKLGREILALVKATTNRDALNDLLIIREDDLAALKKASPDTKGADGKVVLGGYSRLMENVSKQDKFLAEDHTPISGA